MTLSLARRDDLGPHPPLDPPTVPDHQPERTHEDHQGRDGDDIGPCSRLGDIIAFARDGTMRVVRNAEQVFIGKNNLFAHQLCEDYNFA